MDSDLISVEYDIFFEFWVGFAEKYNLNETNIYVGVKIIRYELLFLI